jgi:hypothetical protein
VNGGIWMALERARFQARQAPSGRARWSVWVPGQSLTLLRPRTGALRQRSPSWWEPRSALFARAFAIIFFGLAAGLLAQLQQPPVGEEGRSRFCAVDIFVDAGSTPLAAYQLQFAATNGVAKIAGVEGGEAAPFRQPPFYDPEAIQHERVIIASFSTAPAASLPTGKTRVATIHLQISGTQSPQFELILQTAGDAQGNKIPAKASLEERKSP